MSRAVDSGQVDRGPVDHGAATPPPSVSGSEQEGAKGTAPAEPPIDRAAALAAGAPRVPANFVYWVLGLVLILSLGGFIAERLFSSAGLNPAPTSTSTTAARTPPAATPGAPTPVPDRSLGAPLTAFMGLSTPGGSDPRPAPLFSLTDQNGQPVSMPVQPPSVVVLTFFDAPCNDICPVLASEIEQADADLGPQAAHVEFLTVNTDPSALAASAARPAVGGAGLGSLANWHMLTGPLAALNKVWKAYGISITVATKTGLEAHNNVIDFIDEQGDLRYRATPFANESSTGTFSLPAATVVRWGKGIATYAEKLRGQ